MNKAFLEDLCAKIQLPEEDRELAFQEMERQPKRIERFARRMYQRNDVRHLQGLLKIDRKKMPPWCLPCSSVQQNTPLQPTKRREFRSAIITI